jgi:pyruvate dehydrogenase E1 component
VIKVIWGSEWDELLARDKDGILKTVMMETVDGEYQNYKAKDGAYVRQHFFGKHPKLLEMVSHMSDDEIWRLTRGGHDPQKVYTAFKAAQEHKGQPTVLLCKTVKGFGMGKSGEALNTAHQTKKLDEETIRAMRDRFSVPIPDDQLHDIPFFKPAEDTPEIQYLHERRKALGGYLPHRRTRSDENMPVPDLSTFQPVLEPTAAGRETSTTQAYVRVLGLLLRDENLGKRIVPIMVDESRTFGMEGLFRQIGIFSHQGQLYEPVDIDQVMYYREDKSGQILQDGINEAGGMGSSYCVTCGIITQLRCRLGPLIFLMRDSGKSDVDPNLLKSSDGHGNRSRPRPVPPAATGAAAAPPIIALTKFCTSWCRMRPLGPEP